MNIQKSIPAGVIEGFFGRTWQWPQRRALAPFLREHRLDFYLYAPKADRHLRTRWRTPHPATEWQELEMTRAAYRRTGVGFGVGLSPLDLCTDQGIADSAALDRKIRQLNTLELDYLALLFDDMHGSIPQLACRQAELANRAADTSNATHIILCPTYYSTDPVLEKVFGQAPDHYLATLGKHLDTRIGIFWTGPRVCSEHYPTEHLTQIAEQLGRKPFLWDNYPVNDGALRSQYLYLNAPNQDRATAAGHISGIAANPMNQFAASLPALAGLGHALCTTDYNPEKTTRELLAKLFPPVAHRLSEDIELFAQQGLERLSEKSKQSLLKAYRPLCSSAPIAQEICDWLQGGYTFDPNCLTE